MLEKMLTAANRLTRFVNAFSNSPRKIAHLPVNIALVSANEHTVKPLKRPTLEGKLRDISATGLSMDVPTIRLGGHYFAGVDRTLAIDFELASGPVQFLAAPVRYERLEHDDGISFGYVIGAEITEISDADRTRLQEYLKSLK
jgi:PilZ domain